MFKILSHFRYLKKEKKWAEKREKKEKKWAEKREKKTLYTCARSLRRWEDSNPDPWGDGTLAPTLPSTTTHLTDTDRSQMWPFISNSTTTTNSAAPSLRAIYTVHSFFMYTMYIFMYRYVQLQICAIIQICAIMI